jgi:hypothetical protein
MIKSCGSLLWDCNDYLGHTANIITKEDDLQIKNNIKESNTSPKVGCRHFR